MAVEKTFPAEHAVSLPEAFHHHQGYSTARGDADHCRPEVLM